MTSQFVSCGLNCFDGRNIAKNKCNITNVKVYETIVFLTIAHFINLYIISYPYLPKIEIICRFKNLDKIYLIFLEYLVLIPHNLLIINILFKQV